MNDRIVAIWIVVWLIVGVAFFGFLTNANPFKLSELGPVEIDNLIWRITLCCSHLEESSRLNILGAFSLTLGLPKLNPS